MRGLTIREEAASDHDVIHTLISKVFHETYGSGEKEAILVAQLRQNPEFGPIISVVAELDGNVIGQSFFSAVRLSSHPNIAVCALGPMGVYRQHQRQGIGSQLVQRGLKECARMGYRAVFVQGSLEFYPKFGFIPISHTRLQTIFNSDHDMVMEIERGILGKLSGLVDYPTPWDVFK